MWLRAILDVIGLALLLGFMAYLTDKAIDVFVTTKPEPEDALRPRDRVVVVGEGDDLIRLAGLAQAENGTS